MEYWDIRGVFKGYGVFYTTILLVSCVQMTFVRIMSMFILGYFTLISGYGILWAICKYYYGILGHKGCF